MKDPKGMRSADAFGPLTRRAFVLGAGGALGGLLLSLSGGPAAARPRTRLERMLPGARELTVPGPGGLPGLLLRDATKVPRSAKQLPFWGDGANWDRPEYYETIQAGRRMFPKTYQNADVDGDGQDELIARGPSGILVHCFDPDSGQWLDLFSNSTNPPPAWSDGIGWSNQQYYETIQCADIDGDGRAELIGRGGEGIEIYQYDPSAQKWNPFHVPDNPADPNRVNGGLWNDSYGWSNQQYYETIQCADIDGDGKAELIGRGKDGIEIYQYDPSARKWNPFPAPKNPDPNTPGGLWRDDYGWSNQQYYQTIQCAEVLLPGDPGYTGDGTHTQAVLIGRGGNGVETFTYDALHKAWDPAPGATGWSNRILSDLSDNAGWAGAPYYQTIQCADIDGDGKAELIGRGKDGIEIYQYDPSARKWNPFPAPKNPDPNTPGGLWRDDYGWSNQQYYQTIQCADINGDGKAELIGRGGRGLEFYSYDPKSGQWSGKPPLLDEWTDINGWDQSQYYGTIQTARVKGSATNPNNPPGPDDKPVAALIGRSASSIETWRFDGGTGSWQRTSAPWPAFTGDKLVAYNYLTAYFGLVGGGIREHYDNMSQTDFNSWTGPLYHSAGRYDQSPRPAPNLAAPAGVSSTDWADVTWQLYWEMQYVLRVHEWFGTHIGGVITKTFLSEDMSLDAVNAYISLPSDDDTSMALNILSLIFNVAWAVLGAVVPAAEVAQLAFRIAAAVAGCVSTAFEAAADYTPGDGSTSANYADMKGKLANAFLTALDGNAGTQLAITGSGTDKRGQQQNGDWGLLWAIGKQIQSTAWTWPSDEEVTLVHAAQRQYAKEVWGPLSIAKGWGVTNNESTPSGYPTQYLYTSGQQYRIYLAHYRDFPAVATLQQLFDAPQPGHETDVFPLHVPLADVFEGKNGWPKLPGSNSFGATAAPPPPKQPSFGADLQISKLALTRAPATSQVVGAVGDVVATFTLSNHGLGDASNVTLTGGKMGNKQAIAGVPSRHLHLDAHQSRQMTVRFPGSVGAAGARAVLRLSGGYLGGTFGASLRVTLP